MRDVMADATNCLYKNRKRAPVGLGIELSFRAIAAAWQRPLLYDADKVLLKGALIKI